MAFKKGMTKTGGRRAGVPNKKTLIKAKILHESVRRSMDLYDQISVQDEKRFWTYLLKLALTGDMRAAAIIADRLKPKLASIQLQTNDITGQPVTIKHVVEVACSGYDSTKDPEAVSYE